MPKQNPYLIKENYKKVEEVREIDNKYEIPTLEEFMNSYEGSVNYADLNSDDIGTPKGYGPVFGRGGGSSSGSSRDKGGFAGISDGHLFSMRYSNESLDEAIVFATKTTVKGVAAVSLATATGGLAPFVGGGI